MQNERRVLVSALLKAEKSGYSNIVLDNVLNDSDLDQNGRNFVTSAFYGVLERKISIDNILNLYLKRPIDKAPPLTAAVLRSGVQQIVFMNKIPDSAAVNEAVKLIKKSKESGNSGLVNAVLRKVSSKDHREYIESHEKTDVRYSVAEWIYSSLKEKYSKERTNAFLENSLLPPPVFVRLNTKFSDSFELLKKELAEHSATLIPTSCADVYKANNIRNIEKLAAYKNGLFFVQDLSSRLAVKALGAKPGERILDCCAAPGGKSFSIALDMEDMGEVVSCDIHPHRVSLIEKGAERLRLKSITPKVLDATIFDERLGLFDRVLCDAPCSGIGVIRRKPEIKYKEDNECLALVSLQNNILKNVSRYVKKGGRLIYSTCTLLERENDGVIRHFLNDNTDFKLVSVLDGHESDTKTFMPPYDEGDGFFIAVMERV